MKPKLKLTENDVEKAVVDFLRVEGWRVLRMQSGLFLRPNGGRVRIGELGLPDWIAVRANDHLFVEVKRPGRLPEPQQALWIGQAVREGLSATWTDDFEDFRRWYEEREERRQRVRA